MAWTLFQKQILVELIEICEIKKVQFTISPMFGKSESGLLLTTSYLKSDLDIYLYPDGASINSKKNKIENNFECYDYNNMDELRYDLVHHFIKYNQ